MHAWAFHEQRHTVVAQRRNDSCWATLIAHPRGYETANDDFTDRIMCQARRWWKQVGRNPWHRGYCHVDENKGLTEAMRCRLTMHEYTMYTFCTWELDRLTVLSHTQLNGSTFWRSYGDDSRSTGSSYTGHTIRANLRMMSLSWKWEWKSKTYSAWENTGPRLYSR